MIKWIRTIRLSIKTLCVAGASGIRALEGAEIAARRAGGMGPEVSFAHQGGALLSPSEFSVLPNGSNVLKVMSPKWLQYVDAL